MKKKVKPYKKIDAQKESPKEKRKGRKEVYVNPDPKQRKDIDRKNAILAKKIDTKLLFEAMETEEFKRKQKELFDDPNF